MQRFVQFTPFTHSLWETLEHIIQICKTGRTSRLEKETNQRSEAVAEIADRTVLYICGKGGEDFEGRGLKVGVSDWKLLPTCS